MEVVLPGGETPHVTFQRRRNLLHQVRRMAGRLRIRTMRVVVVLCLGRDSQAVMYLAIIVEEGTTSCRSDSLTTYSYSTDSIKKLSTFRRWESPRLARAWTKAGFFRNADHQSMIIASVVFSGMRTVLNMFCCCCILTYTIAHFVSCDNS